MDLNILSLLPEILAKIFPDIPWKQLINIKLSSRKFNYVTENYLRYMQKPKIDEIGFFNDYTHNDGIGRIRVTYKILITGANGFEDISDLKEFFLLPSEIDKLHSFFQKVDLTSLCDVDTSLDNHSEVIRIFSDYYHNPCRIGFLCVTVRNCGKDVNNTLSFLRKIQNVERLMLDLHFPHINIPRDFIIPVRNSLKMLDICEDNDTAFINPRMIKYIVENNPNLCHYRFELDNFETYKMVIETVVKEELSRSYNGCFHRGISLFLGISSGEVLSE
uniref:F-box domain-containing protein n=1 Tax=Strongyloides papillosus TaxID=174720 RepID=A0A0N5BZT0_STREA